MSISSVGSSGYSYSISTRSSTQSSDQTEMTKKMAAALMEKADTDGDDSLSLSELDDNSDLMTAGDTDGDGQLSETELVSLMNKMAPQGPPPGMDGAEGSSSDSSSTDGTSTSEDAQLAQMVSDLIGNKDSDGDGSLSASELGIDSDTFSTSDTNGDGVLSSDELSAGIQSHEIPPGPPPGPPPGAQASSDSSDSTSSDTSSGSSSEDLGAMLMAFMAKKGMASYQQTMNSTVSSLMSDTSGGGVSLTA